MALRFQIVAPPVLQKKGASTRTASKVVDGAYLRRGVLLIAMLFLTGTAVHAQGLPLTVKIIATEPTVNNNENFFISTIIQNIGADDHSLLIWSCSYPDQWTADKPTVHITSVSCEKNYIMQIQLKPEQSYQRALAVKIRLEGSTHTSVTF